MKTKWLSASAKCFVWHQVCAICVGSCRSWSGCNELREQDFWERFNQDLNYSIHSNLAFGEHMGLDKAYLMEEDGTEIWTWNRPLLSPPSFVICDHEISLSQAYQLENKHKLIKWTITSIITKIFYLLFICDLWPPESFHSISGNKIHNGIWQGVDRDQA